MCCAFYKILFQQKVNQLLDETLRSIRKAVHSRSLCCNADIFYSKEKNKHLGLLYEDFDLDSQPYTNVMFVGNNE